MESAHWSAKSYFENVILVQIWDDGHLSTHVDFSKTTQKYSIILFHILGLSVI